MKLIIAGSRDFNNYNLLEKTVLEYYDLSDIDEVVSGTARGADTLGEQFAAKYNIPVTKFPALWDVYGKSAGYRRNVEMGLYGDALIAFWDGFSKGTRLMIDIAREKNLEVIIKMI